jgi:hypothetical protein
VPACEQSPQSWPRSGISRRPGNPTRPAASRHMLAACARVGVSWRRILCGHMGPPVTLEKGDMRAVSGDDASSAALSRYSFLNSRTRNCSEIGGSRQSRYAPLHLPDHVPHAMNSAPQSPPTVPKPFVEAPSHTPKASTRLPRGRVREGRSFPAIGLHLLGSIAWRDDPRQG